MNKEKIMEFISNVIDEGGKINILIYGAGKTNKDAEKVTQEFAELVDGESEVAIHEKSIWRKVRAGQFQLDHFYDRYEPSFMEEDINLDGGDDHAA